MTWKIIIYLIYIAILVNLVYYSIFKNIIKNKTKVLIFVKKKFYIKLF